MERYEATVVGGREEVQPEEERELRGTCWSTFSLRQKFAADASEMGEAAGGEGAAGTCGGGVNKILGG